MNAIAKMVEYAESWLDSGIEYSRGQIIEAMINKARELAQAEKEKPTAPASLHRCGDPNSVCDMDCVERAYRPASPAVGIVGGCEHNRIRQAGVEGDIGGRPWKMYVCENCGKRFDGELI